MNKLYINGTEVTSDIIEGLDEFEIELGLNTSNKTIGKMLSLELVAEGVTAKMLYSYFYTKCDDWQKTLPARFYTSLCGGITIDCEITSEGLSYTPNAKTIAFNLKSGDQISRAFASLDSELITANGFIENNDTPIMYYVDQPSWLQWALILLTIWTRVVFNVIDVFLGAVCDAINFLNPFGDPLKCDNIVSGAIFSAFDTWLTGTGRWSVAPLIREMINYQCTAVGLKFVSSILNDPSSSRYNAALFCLVGGEHGDYKNTSRLRVQEIFTLNSPQYTTTGLLDKLKEVFKADYRIIGDTLYFEREDYFDEIKQISLFDLADHCLDEDIKISINTDTAVAYSEYQYTQDAYDNGANKLIRQGGNYYELVDFNDPYNPAQKGKKIGQIPFGASRFMFDDVSYRSTGFFNLDKLMDDFRNGPETFIEGFVSTEGLKRKYDLKLTASSLSVEKLLILENNFNRKDALVYKAKIAPNYYLYNSPLHLNEEATYKELIKDFLYLDNPRLRKDIFKISDFEIDCDCDVAKMLLDNFQTCYISSPGIGKIIFEQATLAFTEKGVKISFSGCKAYC